MAKLSKKGIFIALFLLLMIVVSSCILNKLKPAPNQWLNTNKQLITPFEWTSMQQNNVYDSVAAMLIPVYIKDCPKQFYMQFDMGHPTTILYKCVLDQIQSTYQNLNYEQGKKNTIFKNFNFTINNYQITEKEIAVLDCQTPTINWADSTNKIVIGSLGSDLIENKILMIDYPLKSIFIGENMPNIVEIADKLSDFKFTFRRILLPATLNKKKKNIFFDTGSSMFELIVDEKNWTKLSKKGATAISYPINSWGKTWTAHTIASDDSIQFKTIGLPIHNVTYMEGPSAMIQILYKFSGVGGLTGNKLFLKNKIILDTKKLKFAIL